LRSATKAGLIDEVSVADVPNMAQLYPNFMPLGGYGLPFCIGHRADLKGARRRRRRLSDLANPELKGRRHIQSRGVGGSCLISLAEANGGNIEIWTLDSQSSRK
jgi:hypothetical protein